MSNEVVMERSRARVTSRDFNVVIVKGASTLRVEVFTMHQPPRSRLRPMRVELHQALVEAWNDNFYTSAHTVAADAGIEAGAELTLPAGRYRLAVVLPWYEEVVREGAEMLTLDPGQTRVVDIELRKLRAVKLKTEGRVETVALDHGYCRASPDGPGSSRYSIELIAFDRGARWPRREHLAWLQALKDQLRRDHARLEHLKAGKPMQKWRERFAERPITAARDWQQGITLIQGSASVEGKIEANQKLSENRAVGVARALDILDVRSRTELVDPAAGGPTRYDLARSDGKGEQPRPIDGEPLLPSMVKSFPEFRRVIVHATSSDLPFSGHYPEPELEVRVRRWFPTILDIPSPFDADFDARMDKLEATDLLSNESVLFSGTAAELTNLRLKHGGAFTQMLSVRVEVTNLLDLPRDVQFDLERLDFASTGEIEAEDLRASVQRFDRKFRATVDGGIAFTEIVLQLFDWGKGELRIDASFSSSSDGYAHHSLFRGLHVGFEVPRPQLRWVLDPPQQTNLHIEDGRWRMEHNRVVTGYLTLDEGALALSPDKIYLHTLRAIDRKGVEEDGVYYANSSFGQGQTLEEQKRFERIERVCLRRYFRFVADGNAGTYELRGGVANVDDTKSAPVLGQLIDVVDGGPASPLGLIAYSNEKGRMQRMWETVDKATSGQGDDGMPNWVFLVKALLPEPFDLLDQVIFFIGGLKTVWANFERSDIYVTSLFQGVAQATTDILALGLWRFGNEKAREVIWKRRQGREYARWDGLQPVVGDREKQTTWLKRMIEMEQRGWDYATQWDNYRWEKQTQAQWQHGAWPKMIEKLKAQAKKWKKTDVHDAPAPPTISREELMGKVWASLQKGAGFEHLKSRSLRRYEPTQTFDPLSARVPDSHAYPERPAFYKGYGL